MMYFKEYRHYNLSHGDPIQILRVAGFAGGMLLIFFGIFVLALSAREGGGDEKNRPSVGDDHAAGEASKGRDRMQSTSKTRKGSQPQKEVLGSTPSVS